MEQHQATDARMSEEQVERENTLFLYLSKQPASEPTTANEGVNTVMMQRLRRQSV